MSCTVREDGNVVILELAGKIMGTHEDTSLVDVIRDLGNQNKVQVVLDLSHVDWMNSVGLGLCITMMTSLRNREGDLKLANPSEKVTSFLEKCRMFAVFETFEKVDQAVASFK